MYNGNKINELLHEQNRRSSDLLAHLGLRENGSLSRFFGSDIKASRLEQIADFFGVSIDTFFVRNAGIVITGDTEKSIAEQNRFVYGSATSRAREAEAKVKSLEREMKAKDELLAERNHTIALLKEMVEMLKKSAD